jgi:apolipoprotein N-acyltransferase
MLMHPLLPFAEQPMLLALLPYAGKYCLLAFVYGFAGFVTMFLLSFRYIYVLGAILMLIPWCISIILWAQQCSGICPHWLQRIASVPHKFPKIENHSITARTVREHIKDALQKKTTADIVIIPESSVYSPYVLNTPALISHLDPMQLERPVHAIIGSFYDENGLYRNSCYWVKNGVVQQRFDKRHAMVMIERMPRFFRSSFMKNMYFKTMPEIIKSSNARPCFSLSENLCFVPYICSELFFNEYPDDSHGSTPILLISNDAWCPAFYVRRLMYLMVRFKAIQWQRPILYVSYHHTVFFDERGDVYLID